ncbi:hypothetical protein SDC9_152147 [bioreactor metagenome]|uniref:Uncharacterized protein n=1 Tax=bioreactor metagenome TaxID=1076179 RepID=A0A645EUM6_9ZZZZ
MGAFHDHAHSGDHLAARDALNNDNIVFPIVMAGVGGQHKAAAQAPAVHNGKHEGIGFDHLVIQFQADERGIVIKEHGLDCRHQVRENATDGQLGGHKADHCIKANTDAIAKVKALREELAGDAANIDLHLRVVGQ